MTGTSVVSWVTDFLRLDLSIAHPLLSLASARLHIIRDANFWDLSQDFGILALQRDKKIIDCRNLRIFKILFYHILLRFQFDYWDLLGGESSDILKFWVIPEYNIQPPRPSAWVAVVRRGASASSLAVNERNVS